MIHSPLGPGIFELIGVLVWGVVVLLVVAVTVVVAILLVRFLLVGTRAAKLYIAQHEPQAAATLTEPAPVVPPVADEKD